MRKHRLGWAAAAAVVTALAGCTGSSPGAAAAPVYDRLHGSVPVQHPPKPHFSLPDTSGHPFDFTTETAGKATLLYLGYTHCPDECPTSMADVANALRRVPPAVAADVEVVFVTTDPARDTDRALRNWLDRFDPSFVGLRGTPDQIHGAEAAIGVPPSGRKPIGKHGKGRGYAVTHFAAVMAFDRDGRLATLYPAGVAPSEIAADLPLLTMEDGSQ